MRPRDHSKTKHFSSNSNHSAKASWELYPGCYSRAAQGRSLEVKNPDFISADDATKEIRQGDMRAHTRDRVKQERSLMSLQRTKAKPTTFLEEWYWGQKWAISPTMVCTLTLLFVPLQCESAAVCSKLALHHLLLPNVISPVVFLSALSNAGLSKSIHTATASQVPPPCRPVSQGNTALQQLAYRLQRTLGKPHSTQWSFRNTNATLVFPQSLQNVSFLVKHKPQASARGKHSWFILSVILAVNATVQRVTEFICLFWSNIKQSQAGILSPWSEAWYHLLLTHLTNCALKDL